MSGRCSPLASVCWVAVRIKYGVPLVYFISEPQEHSQSQLLCTGLVSQRILETGCLRDFKSDYFFVWCGGMGDGSPLAIWTRWDSPSNFFFNGHFFSSS